MGQEILYCFKCQERVTSGDLDASKALRFGTRTACKKCMPDLLASLTDKERTELVSKVQSGTDLRAGSSARQPISTSTPRPRSVPVPAASAPSSSATMWGIAGGAVVVVLVAAVVLMNSGGATPVSEPRPVTPVPRPPSESSRDRAAREALERAKSLPASDFDRQIAAYAEAARLAEGTPYLNEAKERHDGVLDMRRKAYAREIAAVDERARAMIQKEDFGAAISAFEGTRSLHGGPEWKGLVDERVEQVRKTAESVYVVLKDSATIARTRGAEEEVKALRERISRWGLPEKGKDLDASLAALVPAVPDRPWTSVFDGKSLDFIFGKGEGAWTIENGLLVHVKGKKPSAQTKRHFSDGELRIRFEGRQLDHAGFAIRQDLNYYSVSWDKITWTAVGDGEHELHFAFRGNEVSATLDGKPLPIQKKGQPPPQGPLQFNAGGEYFAVKSIEFREPALTDGLVGHWTFDSTAGGKAVDSSPLKNDGILIDAPVEVPGRIGNALQFDGRKAQIKVPAHPSLNMTGPFSISVWVKPVPLEDRRAYGVVERWDPGSKDARNGYFLRIIPGGRVTFVFWDAIGETESSTQRPVPPDEWTFLTGVFDGPTIKMYMNGKHERTAQASRIPLSSVGPLWIGVGGGDGAHQFKGAIDDVRLYNRALTASEIATLAQGK